ncbi:MAG: hypothetical protein HRU70_13905 [Phycisphaeraceae bacterium]|nr:MAG: hypothetical protein HRU70_13905 [Phycisphaeraceae bacterium]
MNRYVIRTLTACAGLALLPMTGWGKAPDPTPGPDALIDVQAIPEHEIFAAQMRRLAAPRPLFIPAAAPEGAQPLPQAVAFMPAAIDLDYLKSMRPGMSFEMTPEPGVSLIADVTKVERRAQDRLSVFGKLRGISDSEFILVLEIDAVAGDIVGPSANVHYKLRYAGDGVYLVCDINPELYLPCAGSDTAPPMDPGEFDFEPDLHDEMGIELPTDDGSTEGSCSNIRAMFDMGIWYTVAARTAMGGTNPANAECQLATDRQNESYINSGINARARLVFRGVITYTESGNSSTDLGRWRDPSDGFLDGAHATRDAENVDFAVLFVDQLDACGRAYCTADAASAFGVVAWSCASGNLSHAHEVGHNQGCDHDPDNITSGCAWANYGYGHRFTGTNGTQYRTVMAYAPGSRVSQFSNPNVTFQGTATGTATRDNARIINNRDRTCENFELTRVDIWVDFAYTNFVYIGTFTIPYNNMTSGINAVRVPTAPGDASPNLYMKGGTTAWTGTISKAMTLRSCGGVTNIGGNP